MFHVGDPCPVCAAGFVGFVLCSDQKTVVMVCEECDSLWKVPGKITSETALYTDGPDFTVPGLNCSIAHPAARWAERNDIEKVGWGDFIHGEEKAMDETRPLKP